MSGHWRLLGVCRSVCLAGEAGAQSLEGPLEASGGAHLGL